jgi:hypothetical protein
MAEQSLNEPEPRPGWRFFVVAVPLVVYSVYLLYRYPHLSNLEFNIVRVGAPLLIFYGYLKLFMLPMLRRKVESEDEHSGNLLNLK